MINKDILYHEGNKNLFLIKIDKINSINTCWTLSKKEKTSLLKINDWLNYYLCAPLPSLGRIGNVCPFVEPAIKKYNSIYMSTISLKNDSVETAKEIVLEYFEWYLKISQKEKHVDFLSFILLFPEIAHNDCPLFIDVIHRELKKK